MRVVVAAIFLAWTGVTWAQLSPSGGSTQRDGAQPAGPVLQPTDPALQPQLRPGNPPPQNPPTFGGPVGGPIQDTGSYGNLGIGERSKQGTDGARSLVRPDYGRPDDQNPFERR
jgi:hypothetical protein